MSVIQRTDSGEVCLFILDTETVKWLCEETNQVRGPQRGADDAQ
jgi:hypothetical protein